MSGTMKMKHPKRGGWKGAKTRKRNFNASEAFKNHQRENRGKQIWVETDSAFMYIPKHIF